MLGNWDISFSTLLNNILGFKTFKYDTNQYRLIYPTLNYQTTDMSTYYDLTQHQSTLYLFQNINKISVETSMPLVKESITGKNSKSSILTDYAIDNSTTEGNQYLIYNTSGYNRMYQLTSQEPLYNIDFKFTCSYNNGIVTNVYLNQGESFDVKFMFQKISDNYISF
jgi:hypothetical protein